MFIYHNGPDVNTTADILLPRTDLNDARTPAFAVRIESRLQILTSMLLHPHQVLPVGHPASLALWIRQAEAMFSLSGSADHDSPDFLQTRCESSGDVSPSNA